MSESTALETVNTQTGELVPVATDRVPLEQLFIGASTQPVSEAEAKVLMAPCDLDDLDILPTGEVYLSQIGYRRRLNGVFRPGGWALVPLDKPGQHRSTVMQPWALYVRGVFIASCYGEADYQPSNPRQSYATAAESLKSNALMRCCKDLGIASECWDRRFTEKFKRDYCEKFSTPKGPQWRRKEHSQAPADRSTSQVQDMAPERTSVGTYPSVPNGGDSGEPMFEGDVFEAPPIQPKAPKPDKAAVYGEPVISDPQSKRFYAIAKGNGWTDDDIKTILSLKLNVKSSKDIPRNRYEEICAIVAGSVDAAIAAAKE